jgi:hypothetical protein
VRTVDVVNFGSGLVVGTAAGVTGQTVVYMETICVVTEPIGQLVTVGAHEVIV